MMDLDHFKAFNDRYGHFAGDEVLRRCGALVADLLRGADLVARYGGEEFLAVLPRTDKASAVQVAYRIHHGLMNLKIEYGGSVLPPVSASIGMATFTPEDETEEELSPEALVEKADRALYQAKQEGRNGIVALAVGAADLRVRRPGRG